MKNKSMMLSWLLVLLSVILLAAACGDTAGGGAVVQPPGATVGDGEDYNAQPERTTPSQSPQEVTDHKPPQEADTLTDNSTPMEVTPESDVNSSAETPEEGTGSQSDFEGITPPEREEAPDRDGDGHPDHVDNCPDVANDDQLDSDGDRVGDGCESCPFDPNKILTGDCGCGNLEFDGDGDGVSDCIDNCPETHNPIPEGMIEQSDWNGDGFGDECPPVNLVEVRYHPDLAYSANLFDPADPRYFSPIPFEVGEVVMLSPSLNCIQLEDILSPFQPFEEEEIYGRVNVEADEVLRASFSLPLRFFQATDPLDRVVSCHFNLTGYDEGHKPSHGDPASWHAIHEYPDWNDHSSPNYMRMWVYGSVEVRVGNSSFRQSSAPTGLGFPLATLASFSDNTSQVPPLPEDNGQ